MAILGICDSYQANMYVMTTKGICMAIKGICDRFLSVEYWITIKMTYDGYQEDMQWLSSYQKCSQCPIYSNSFFKDQNS